MRSRCQVFVHEKLHVGKICFQRSFLISNLAAAHLLEVNHYIFKGFSTPKSIEDSKRDLDYSPGRV